MVTLDVMYPKNWSRGFPKPKRESKGLIQSKFLEGIRMMCEFLDVERVVVQRLLLLLSKKLSETVAAGGRLMLSCKEESGTAGVVDAECVGGGGKTPNDVRKEFLILSVDECLNGPRLEDRMNGKEVFRDEGIEGRERENQSAFYFSDMRVRFLHIPL